MRRLALVSLLLAVSAAAASAQSTVDTLLIDVSLQDNGNAAVTEAWSIDVSDNITEWYLVVDHLGKMGLRNLKVTDETGLDYVNEGEWDIDRTREEKAGRCGLVTKSDGYEICWGVGSSGPHDYFASYELTGLVQGHSDMDGFNYMFVARDLGSPPDYIQVKIHKRDTSFSFDNSKIWAFGFKGNVNFEDGNIVARTSEPFSQRSGMIILAGFNIGIFSPEIQDSSTFDEVRQEALKDSDYREPSQDRFSSFLDKVVKGFFLGLCGLGAFLFVRYKVKARKRRKELLGGKMKDVPWFRGVPVKGNLRNAYSIVQVMTHPSEGQQNLISAYMTRLFYRNAFTIVPDVDGNKAVKVGELPAELADDSVEDKKLEAELFGFFKEAAGEDGILQKKELKKWLNRNKKRIYEWRKKFNAGDTIWTLRPTDVQEVFGLRKFLKDFTLIDDRGVVEVGLWNNYLIFASLYGIADQVKRDFNKVCPEYFQLSKVAETLNDPGSFVFWDMVNYSSANFNYAAASYESRISSGGSSWGGGGGGASWGGGGGFSGGGSGGGGR